MREVITNKDALLIIDVQNDFCPGGKLAVPDGDQVVQPINELLPLFGTIIQTQDWHPSDHTSFANQHNDKEPYETITLEYGDQVLWPEHCVQGSSGADFHPELITTKTTAIVRKGFRAEIDSYSAFLENDHKTKTGLDGLLNSLGIDRIFVCGLATDFCVKWSALDAVKFGFTTFLIDDAVKGIDLDNSVDTAIQEMKAQNITLINSTQITRK